MHVQTDLQFWKVAGGQASAFAAAMHSSAMPEEVSQAH